MRVVQKQEVSRIRWNWYVEIKTIAMLLGVEVVAKAKAVPVSRVHILRKAIEFDGEPKPATQFPGTPVPDRKKKLQELANDGLLEQSGTARSPKYAITEEGHDELARLDPEYGAERERKKGEKQRKALSDELATLEKQHADAIQKLHDFHERIVKGYNNLGQGGSGSQLQQQSSVEQQLDIARTAYATALKEIQGPAYFLPIAQQLQAAIESAIPNFNSEFAKLQHDAKQWPDTIKQTRESFAQRHQEIKRELATLQKPAENQSTGKAASRTEEIDRNAVWETTQREYERLKSNRSGKSVKLPQLTDAVADALPSLSRPTFLEYMMDWHEKQKLHLGVLNKLSDDDRHSEGIRTPGGMLFYVDMD